MSSRFAGQRDSRLWLIPIYHPPCLNPVLRIVGFFFFFSIIILFCYFYIIIIIIVAESTSSHARPAPLASGCECTASTKKNPSRLSFESAMTFEMYTNPTLNSSINF